MDPIDLEIGARLRELRESRGMTRPDLAQAVGVDPREIEECEAGAVSAPIALIIRCARALRGSAAEIVGDGRESWRHALDGLARNGAHGSVELVAAFSSIPDEHVRRAILDLAWTIVATQDKADPKP